MELKRIYKTSELIIICITVKYADSFRHMLEFIRFLSPCIVIEETCLFNHLKEHSQNND